MGATFGASCNDCGHGLQITEDSGSFPFRVRIFVLRCAICGKEKRIELPSGWSSADAGVRPEEPVIELPPESVIDRFVNADVLEQDIDWATDKPEPPELAHLVNDDSYAHILNGRDAEYGPNRWLRNSIADARRDVT